MGFANSKVNLMFSGVHSSSGDFQSQSQLTVTFRGSELHFKVSKKLLRIVGVARGCINTVASK
jgi:hypothetical protein